MSSAEFLGTIVVSIMVVAALVKVVRLARGCWSDSSRRSASAHADSNGWWTTLWFPSGDAGQDQGNHHSGHHGHHHGGHHSGHHGWDCGGHHGGGGHFGGGDFGGGHGGGHH